LPVPDDTLAIPVHRSLIVFLPSLPGFEQAQFVGDALKLDQCRPAM
jgi:hypothetical protein